MVTSLTGDRTHSDDGSRYLLALTAKYWTPDCFPATTHDLLAVSMVRHSPGSLWWLLNQLPQAERFPRSTRFSPVSTAGQTAGPRSGARSSASS
jgi:hypothetical protein